MSSRVALFNSTKDGGSQDSEKLLDLYWNRAELKKAYAEARNEQHRLKKIIDEHRGTAARIEQQLANLESLLVDPAWVHSVAVHYQLRAINNRCRSRLARFAEQLKQQREQRLHQKLVDEWKRKRGKSAEVVESKLAKLRVQMQQCEEDIGAAQQRVDSLNIFVRLFRGKEARNHLATLQEQHAVLMAKESEQLERLQALQAGSPPAQQGLDVAAKRSINFMILAFAQQLYILFADDGLAALARQSGEKSVGAVNYGSKEDCDRIIASIGRRWNAFDKVMEYADELQQRARLLSEKALFMKDDDTVPNAATVAYLIVFNSSGTVSQQSANLLGENYWDLSNVLSR